MAKIKLTKVPFAGTPEQAKQLEERLEALKSVPGGLMPALQQAQDIYGYLPIEVQMKIADTLLSIRSSPSIIAANIRFPYVSEPPATSKARETSSTPSNRRSASNPENVPRTGNSAWSKRVVSAAADSLP